MKLRPSFRYCEPTFFAGLFDDPLLLVRVRPLGESLLFDCGQIHHLAKRVLKSITALFITHAHMDHFMGLDTIIRHTHVSPRTIDIFGPPGIAAKLASKLAGYDWNLTESSWCSYRVHEILADRLVISLFPGAEGFPRRLLAERPRTDQEIYRNDYLRVEAELCDHKIPVVAYRLSEKEAFLLDEGKIDRAGLVRGEWLRELRKRICFGSHGREPLTVLRQGSDGVEEQITDDCTGLYRLIRREDAPASIGYVTDIGWHEGNRAKLLPFLRGVRLLVCECAFLAEDRAKARASHHLCSSDLNCLTAELRPGYLLPMHLSKTYNARSQLLYAQLAPPPGVTLLRIPDHVTPRPLLACEVPEPERSG